MAQLIPAFCSNLLPQESLHHLFPTLLDFASSVREEAELPLLGIDLKLGFEAIADGQDLDLCRRWRDTFAAKQIVFTSLNIFPLQPFQQKVVKDRAYEPDWGQEARLHASQDAILIAETLTNPQQESCSLSTIPGSYLPWGDRVPSDKKMAGQLGEWVAKAWTHLLSGGRRMVLCIEPEPLCSWGSTPDMISFWENHQEHLIAHAQQFIGADAAEAVQHHVGCCWDTCHASVLFENQTSSISDLTHAGLRPLKVQYSAAPRCHVRGDTQGIEALSAMDEERFCHQVGILNQDNTVEVLEDLPDLQKRLAAWQQHTKALPKQVCTHFHIPVHQSPASSLLSSSINESDEGLTAALAHGAQHISVETYTWNLQKNADESIMLGTAAEVRHLANRLKS